MLHNIISGMLGAISICVLLAEVRPGVAIGWNGEEWFVGRSKNPGLYWLTIALQTFIVLGISVVAYLGS